MGIDVRRMLENRQDESLANRVREAVLSQCVMDGDGRYIRGRVSQVRCGGCGRVRWNDGTPCKQPNKHNPDAECGHRPVRDLEVMEDGREG